MMEQGESLTFSAASHRVQTESAACHSGNGPDHLMTMPMLPTIIAYLDPLCPWTRGVVSFLESSRFEYVYRDIIQNPAAFEEMVAKSGQHSSPCVEVNGHMLADISGDELKQWMEERGLLTS